jgi:hypothetical protein
MFGDLMKYEWEIPDQWRLYTPTVNGLFMAYYCDIPPGKLT